MDMEPLGAGVYASEVDFTTGAMLQVPGLAARLAGDERLKT